MRDEIARLASVAESESMRADMCGKNARLARRERLEKLAAELRALARNGEEDAAINASDNADYIDHCAAKLRRHGYRVTAEVLSAIAVGHRQLEAECLARKTDNLVPGVMHCAKCKFRLHRTTLYMGSGTTGPGDNKTEPCPNGCGPLWPVTWEQEAREAMALANGLHEQLQAAQQQGEEKIACDVKVAPATTFRAGVSLSTVVRAIRSRAEWAAKEGDGPYVFLGKTDHVEDKLGMVAEGWRCFHCSEAFTDAESAALHFGTHERQEPACMIDIAKYREMEALQLRYLDEDADVHRTMRRMETDHQQALRRAEESGYAKGLVDAVKYPKDAAPAPDHSAGVGVSLHRKARALLAAEYDRDGQAFVADRIRTDAMLTHVEDRSLRAIVSALAQPADAEAAPNG